MRVGSFTRFRCRILVIFMNLLFIWLLLLLINNYISKATLNIHGKFDAPSIKVTPSGVK